MRSLFCLFLFISPLVFAATAKPAKTAVEETLIWLSEKEQFQPHDCRLATRDDVRANKINELSDVILEGKTIGRTSPNEINVGYYVRLRFSETASDTLGSRLGRMGLALTDVPLKSCRHWNEALAKKPKKR